MAEVKKISILIADDHSIARAGIRAMLELAADDIEIVGEAQNGDEAINLIKKLKPQILLLDLIMPGLRPAEVEKWVRTNHPETSTLVLTAHDRDIYLANMIDVGTAGYLSKEISAQRLIGAIRRAAKGEILFDSAQRNRAHQWRKDIGEKLKRLTNREKEILELLAKGMDNRSIAINLGVSLKTISFHVTNLLSKLQLKSRQEAAAWAVKHLYDNLE